MYPKQILYFPDHIKRRSSLLSVSCWIQDYHASEVTPSNSYVRDSYLRPARRRLPSTWTESWLIVANIGEPKLMTWSSIIRMKYHSEDWAILLLSGLCCHLIWGRVVTIQYCCYHTFSCYLFFPVFYAMIECLYNGVRLLFILLPT